MFTKLASFAAAALVLATIAPPAHAQAQAQMGLKANGTGLNGGTFNGGTFNGGSFNGGGLQGTSLNGGGLQGTSLNGGGLQGTSAGTSSFAIDGIELPAAMR